MQHKIRLWGLFALCTSLFWGCQPPVVSDNPATGRLKTMVLHLTDDPAGLNPVNTVGATTVALQNLMFDHLIGLDAAKLILVPRLAQAMPTVSEDKLSYIFTLREGLQFADRSPLTSEDVVFSFKALMNPNVSSAPRRAELHNFEDCIALDERRVEFRLKASGPFNLNRLAINFFVIPKHIYDPNNLSDGYTAKQAIHADSLEFWGQNDAKESLIEFAAFFEDEKFQREKGYIVGSGRYVFDSWKAGQFVRLVKNQHYWGEGSSNPFDHQGMDTLVYKIIPDLQTTLKALRAGEIDFSDYFEPQQFKEDMVGEAFDKHFAKESVPYPFFEYIGWNQNIKGAPQKDFFADARVRLALSKLVNVEEIINNALYGTGKPISSMVHAQRAEFNKDLKPIENDPEGAVKLLAEAGWVDSDGNGVLDKRVKGKLVEFSFVLNYKRGNELRKSVARHVKDKFEKVGIEVEIQDVEGSVLLDRLKQHEIEAWLGGWVFDSDEQDFFSLFHSSQILNEGYNWGSYRNSRADSVMERITLAWDEPQRQALHREIQAILYADQPYTLLFTNAARMGWNTRLENEGWYGQRPCYDPGQFHLAGSKP